MQPQRPVHGPADEAGFVFALFEPSDSVQTASPQVVLVGADEDWNNSNQTVFAEDNNCACDQNCACS